MEQSKADQNQEDRETPSSSGVLLRKQKKFQYLWLPSAARVPLRPACLTRTPSQLSGLARDSSRGHSVRFVKKSLQVRGDPLCVCAAQGSHTHRSLRSAINILLKVLAQSFLLPTASSCIQKLPPETQVLSAKPCPGVSCLPFHLGLVDFTVTSVNSDEFEKSHDVINFLEYIKLEAVFLPAS